MDQIQRPLSANFGLPHNGSGRVIRRSVLAAREL